MVSSVTDETFILCPIQVLLSFAPLRLVLTFHLAVGFTGEMSNGLIVGLISGLTVGLVGGHP